jgi:hypothetical protein
VGKIKTFSMNRKLFLKNLFFLTGGILAGADSLQAAIYRKPRKIHGRVRSGSKGIANVVVSDGFSVVATDRKGRYEITTHGSAQFITVSIPAGFQFPHESSIARCYQQLSSENNVYDFSLQPLAADDTKHRFIIWADPQVKNAKDVEKLMSQSVPDMQAHIAQNNNMLLHGICVGDIVWDEHALYKDYNKAVEKMSIPFFQVLGNHDMDYKGSDDSVSDVTFKAHYGPTYYSFNRGKVHYVVLDDVRYLGKERQYDGYVPERQLEWLKKDLAFVPKDHLVVVCLHIPVYSSVVNRAALYEIIRPWKTHIMSGHTHTNNNIEGENVYEHVHGTVCGAWWTGPICGDGTPPGYAVYDVDGADLKWYYKPVGKELNYQSSIFMHTNASGQREMVANVWNWDAGWKVTWQADETVKGELFSVEDFDPLAVSLYKGDQLPAGRPFVEPRKTKHIFKTIIPDGVGSVKLLATDRFGNRFETIARVNA